MRARLVVDTDDWEGAGGWNTLEAYPAPLKWFFAWQERWGLTHAHAVTVASRALQTLVWALGVKRDRVVYVPNGAPTACAMLTLDVPTLSVEPTLLLYTRFFEFDLERIARLLVALGKQHPSLHFTIVGQGFFGEEKKFASLLAGTVVAERTQWLGWLPAAELPAVFAEATLALFPFDDTLLNRTKCSIKLADLLCAGVPVVAEAVGQNAEYIVHGESGLLVRSGDEQAMLAAVACLLDDVGLRQSLAAGAQRRMREQFDWDVLALSVERAYAHPVAAQAVYGIGYDCGSMKDGSVSSFTPSLVASLSALEGSGGCFDQDIAEQLILADDDLALFHEFKHRQERYDDLHARAAVSKPGTKGNALATRQAQLDVLHLVADTDDQWRDHVADGRSAVRGQNHVHQCRQVFQRDIGQVEARLNFGAGRDARVGAQSLAFPFLQLQRDLLVAPVFNQLACELVPDIFGGPIPRDGLLRQQQPGFDEQQLRGDDEELRDLLGVRPLHCVQILHILIGDLRERETRDIHLFALDQVQQQIERPFKVGQADSIRGFCWVDHRGRLYRGK